jgi:hypothetical protein
MLGPRSARGNKKGNGDAVSCEMCALPGQTLYGQARPDEADVQVHYELTGIVVLKGCCWDRGETRQTSQYYYENAVFDDFLGNHLKKKILEQIHP